MNKLALNILAIVVGMSIGAVLAVIFLPSMLLTFGIGNWPDVIILNLAFLFPLLGMTTGVYCAATYAKKLEKTKVMLKRPKSLINTILLCMIAFIFFLVWVVLISRAMFPLTQLN